MKKWRILKRFFGIDQVFTQRVAGGELVIVVPLVNLLWWREQQKVRVLGRWWWMEAIEVIEDEKRQNWCEVALSMEEPSEVAFMGESLLRRSQGK